MFKIGDKVVCIDAYQFSNTLKINTIYTITYISNFSGLISIDNKDKNGSWRQHRFKLLSEFRKQKIEKICSKLEKK